MPPEIVSRGIGRDGVGVRRVFPAFVRSGVSLSRAVCGLEIQSVARRWRAGGVRAHLLHLGQPEIEQAVDPVEELRASHEERGVLEPDGRRIRSSHRFFVRLRSRGVRRGAGVRGALGSRRGRGVGSRMTRDRSRRYSRLESVRKRPCVDAISLAACLVAFDVSPGRWFPPAPR